MNCSQGFLYGSKIYNILDFTGNDCFNTLDIILWWCWGVIAVVFYKAVIKPTLRKIN